MSTTAVESSLNGENSQPSLAADEELGVISSPLGAGSLVDQLIDQQDDVIRKLDALDARIAQVIIDLTQAREQTEKSAA